MQLQVRVGIREKFDPFYLLITSFSICSLGNYAVMTVLAIYFVQSLNLAAAQAGALLLFTSLSFRLSRLFIAPVVDRVPLRQAMALSLFLTSAGYLGLAAVRIPLLVVVLLFIIGLGHSTNVLLVKLMVAQAKSKDGKKQSTQFSRYAALTTGVNIAAAVGSSIGGILLAHGGPASVFLVSATSYTLSALIALWIPAMEMGQSKSTNWLAALRLTLKQPAIRRALLFSVFGWFLYTQSYASLPLFVTGALQHPEILSSTFALNAVLVVVGQLPISKAVIYFRIPTSQLIMFAFLTYAIGFALLLLTPSLLIVYVAVTFWTLAEMLLLPSLDSLVAEGALVDSRQAAFALATIAVACGEGLGNLFGVSLGGSLLKSGNFSTLYTILTFGSIGAAVVSVFAVKRSESLIFRLLKGQSPIPTGQTQMLVLEPSPMEKGGMGQSLLLWLGAGSYHDDRSFIEAHPELIALDNMQIDDFIEQQPTESGKAMLADRLGLLRDIRKQFTAFVRIAYVNMYGGLVLDLPKWLEEIRGQLTSMDVDKGQSPDQTASWRVARLDAAITRAKGEPSIAPEIVAELQVLYALAALEAEGSDRAEAVESAIASLQEALKVYTLVQYPYQYARAHVFLSLALQGRVKASRRANLEQALASYEAAAQGYQSDPFPMQAAVTQFTGNLTYSQQMITQKRDELEEAMAHCRMALQELIQQENQRNESEQKPMLWSKELDLDKTLIRRVPEEFAPDKTILHAPENFDLDKTIIRRMPKESDTDKTILLGGNKARAATHTAWLASAMTQDRSSTA